MAYIRASTELDGVEDFFKKVLTAATAQFVTEEKAIALEFNELVLRLTPVWEGTAVVNYLWSFGAPRFAYRPPIESPAYPGPTNSMALGAEPRRPANEAVVRHEILEALVFTEPTDIYLTNSAPHFIELEYGFLPTQERSRVSAQGMVRMAILNTLGRLH